MKKILAIAFIAAIALFAICTVSAESDADANGVLISEVNPTGDDEGVTLCNYGQTTVDLNGYSVADNPSISSGEGYFTFTKSLKLEPGESITIVKNADLPSSKFIGRYTTYVINITGGIESTKQMTLADKGDDVFLFNGSKVVDAFCYGSNTISDSSQWSGDSFKIKTDCYAVRKDVDTNTSSDWYNYKVGWTNIYFDPDLLISAEVTPFLFPDSAGVPIFEELEKAKVSVSLSMYQLSSKDVCALLDKLVKEGVKVTILIEDDRNAVIKVNHCLNEIKTLVDDGCDVRFIELNGRYQWVHAKYCIIDDETVIITSENWTQSNLDRKVGNSSGNRGWGAIVRSAEYADFMNSVFENDIDTSYGDVYYFNDFKPGVSGNAMTYTSKDVSYPTSNYECTLTPVLSPDSSLDATYYYIDNATYRVYSEQQSLTNSYSNVSNESPIKHMATKAKNGVDTRFVLNSDYSSKSDKEEAVQSVKNINESSKIKAANMDSVYVHNKGVICDDTVFVSSVNWTSASLTSNRESCIAIHSKNVSDYYATAFLKDFTENYTYSGIQVSLTVDSSNYGETGEIIATATPTQDGTFVYHWYLDGKELDNKNDRIAVIGVSDGTHTVRTVVNDSTSQGEDSVTFTVGGSSPSPVDPGSDDSKDSAISGIIDKIKPYIIPIIIIILGLFIAILKGASGGKKKKKKGGKKR